MKINNTYSLWHKIYLGICLLRTKLISSKARIIRFPIDIRGKKFINFGFNITTGIGCRLEAFSENGKKTMHFGSDVQINDYVHITAMKNISIGNNVLMASRIYISDCSHGFYKDNNATNPDIPPIKRDYYINPVCIEDNVWIGEGVVIMPGVTIGRGSVIGANSVVTKSIPPCVIAVGNPARIIKKFNSAKNIWEKI